MANLTTNADIINYSLSRASELADGTSDLDADAVEMLNKAYRELYMGGQSWNEGETKETWWWLKAEGSLIMDSDITSGTVSVTNNSVTATFSATPSPTIDSDVTNWFFKVDGEPDIYKVSSITTATATLDSVYTGTTNATATYKLFKLDYDLSSSVIKIIGHMTAYRDGEYIIDQMAMSEMDAKYPLIHVESGVPTKFAPVDENTVRFNKWGPSQTEGDILRLDYDYITLPSDLADDTNEPLVPIQYRQILADMTTFYLLLDKDDTKAETYGLQARKAIMFMAQENRTRWAQTGKPGHIYKRQRQLERRRTHAPYTGVYVR